jgi:hypothetical protein
MKLQTELRQIHRVASSVEHLPKHRFSGLWIMRYYSMKAFSKHVIARRWTKQITSREWWNSYMNLQTCHVRWLDRLPPTRGRSQSSMKQFYGITDDFVEWIIVSLGETMSQNRKLMPNWRTQMRRQMDTDCDVPVTNNSSVFSSMFLHVDNVVVWHAGSLLK